MCNRFRTFCLLLLGAIGIPRLNAAGPDVLILNDDEKLIGQFVRSNGSSVVFKSDLLGEITLDWAKVKEMHAPGPYSVVDKGVKLGRHVDPTKIPAGALEMSGQTITLTPTGAAPQKIPVPDAAHIIDQATLEKAILHRPGVFEAWTGGVTGGVALVEATQQSRTYTAAINLVRAVPTETWLAPRNRTIVNFSLADGTLTQPNSPKLKTEIVHAGLERDEYLGAGAIYAFGQAILDHSFSQGLDLAQTYGGGIGWTAIKKANETLDLNASVNYVRQQFAGVVEDKSLAGSTFAERFKRILPHGIIFEEGILLTPTWTDRKYWMASGTASINVPVYKRFSFSTNVLDSFLHSPPPGFKKNSFQVATGLTCTLH